MKVKSPFYHEKLDVYNQSLAFVNHMDELITSFPEVQFSAIEHLERASESILENIVNGNSQWSKENKSRYFNISYGSALECAGCLDIFKIKKLISQECCDKEKVQLKSICQMLVGLIRSINNEIRENKEIFQIPVSKSSVKTFFPHESLNVYQDALRFFDWIEQNVQKSGLTQRHKNKLDSLSTSIILNIAEGNGRFEMADHRKFIDIAYRSMLKVAMQLDLLHVKNFLSLDVLGEGKQILSRIANMLLGLRGYLKKGEDYERDYERDYDFKIKDNYEV